MNASSSDLRIGAWRVDAASGLLTQSGKTVRIEARQMMLLMHLAARPGQVVSIEELLDQVWTGVVVTPDSVYQAVAALRKLLGDDAREPTYIATVPRLGYRMVATVAPWVDEAPPHPPGGAPLRNRWVITGAVALIILVAAGLFVGITRNDVRSSNAIAALPPARSVAVLPFLDLTSQEMNEEYFADGMTEEIINQLSEVPGITVPAATASFYLKNKQLAPVEIGKMLGVTYLLDGSVRKSDSMLRISARLVRADDAFVIWSQSFDVPSDDVLKAQTDIAGAVATALEQKTLPAQ